MKLKEIAATLLVVTLALGTMVGCGSKGNDNTADSADQTGASGISPFFLVKMDPVQEVHS